MRSVRRSARFLPRAEEKEDVTGSVFAQEIVSPPNRRHRKHKTGGANKENQTSSKAVDVRAENDIERGLRLLALNSGNINCRQARRRSQQDGRELAGGTAETRSTTHEDESFPVFSPAGRPTCSDTRSEVHSVGDGGQTSHEASKL